MNESRNGDEKGGAGHMCDIFSFQGGAMDCVVTSKPVGTRESSIGQRAGAKPRPQPMEQLETSIEDIRARLEQMGWIG